MMMNKRGQATIEMVFMVPLLMALAVGAVAVVYMCWQGIKVQQVANLAARVQGQERVAGGVSFGSIQQDNGTDRSGDVDPTAGGSLDPAALAALEAGSRANASPHTVYGKIQQLVRDQFGANEQKDLFIPAPQYGIVGYSDQIKVVRVWQPPSIFGFKFDPITVQATAYGGEDTRMYGLVRWGRTNAGGGGPLFWADSSNGKSTNLPNPHND